MNLDDIKLYLPKYLSEASFSDLLKELKSFPKNMDKRFYSEYLKKNPTLFQGDGIAKGLPILNLPSTDIRENVPVIVLSNTCDIDAENKREYFSPRISYAPILRLEKYKEAITAKASKDRDKIIAHINSIKNQEITSILYLPQGGGFDYEGIVFLDRIISCDSNSVCGATLLKERMFILSDYGFYLFLFKLSLHFTRVQEQVERRI